MTQLPRPSLLVSSRMSAPTRRTCLIWIWLESSGISATSASSLIQLQHLRLGAPIRVAEGDLVDLQMRDQRDCNLDVASEDQIAPGRRLDLLGDEVLVAVEIDRLDDGEHGGNTAYHHDCRSSQEALDPHKSAPLFGNRFCRLAESDCKQWINSDGCFRTALAPAACSSSTA